MEQSLKIWYLKKFAFFSELTSEQRQFVRHNTKLQAVGKNETIYLEEDTARNVYLLKEGKVRVSKFNPRGTEFLIAILQPGEVFGNSSVFGNSQKRDVAVAEEKSVFYVMREEKMKELLKMNFDLNLRFSKMIQERLEKIQKRLEDITFKNSNERIIEFIKETAFATGISDKNKIVIKNALTHENVAKLTFTSRQLVSTVLSDLKKQKIIDYNRKEMHVLKPEALKLKG